MPIAEPSGGDESGSTVQKPTAISFWDLRPNDEKFETESKNLSLGVYIFT